MGTIGGGSPLAAARSKPLLQALTPSPRTKPPLKAP